MTTNQKTMLNGNKYYEKQWADLRKKMNNKNYKQWEEKNSEYSKS